MRQLLLIGLGILTAVSACTGSAQAAPWARSYHMGADGPDIWCNAVQQAMDGGCVVAGSAGDLQPPFAWSRFAVIKLDTGGQVAWQNTYHDSLYPRQITCLEVIRSNIIVAGFAPKEGKHGTVVMSLQSTTGQVNWERRYWSDRAETAPSSMVKTEDGSVVIAGYIEEEANNRDFWVMKLDPADGRVIWQVAYDHGFSEHAVAIAQMEDGRLIVAGNYLNAQGDYDIWTLQLNSTGGFVRQMDLGGQGTNDQVTSGVVASDSSLVLTGFTDDTGSGTFDIFVLKMADMTSCSYAWAKAYESWDGPDYSYAIVEAQDGDLVVGGKGLVSATGSLDALLLSVPPDGSSIRWIRAYGGSEEDNFLALQASETDSMLIVGGSNASFPVQQHSSIWAMRLNPTGRIAPQDDDACMLHTFETTTISDVEWDPVCSRVFTHRETAVASEEIISTSTPLESTSLRLCGDLTGESQFTDVTDDVGMWDDVLSTRGVAWGDYDGDGYDDLYVTNNGANHLFRNNSGSSFSEVALLAGVDDANNGASGGWGDYDNDGDPDLLVANISGGSLLLQNQGSGSFTNIGVLDLEETWGMAWGDCDADGLLDAFLCTHGQESMTRLYRQTAPGDFEDVAASAGVAYVGNASRAGWADYDDDGDLDLYLTIDDGPDRLYRNLGDGTFEDITPAAGTDNDRSGTSAAWGDYDNDSDLDLFVANYTGPDRLYRNNNDGSFTDVAGDAGVADDGEGTAATWGDCDNDGDLDLYLSTTGANRLFANQGDGTFSEITLGAGVSDTSYGMGAAWCDYDRDGDLDLYLGNWGVPNRLFRNETAESYWLQVVLVGVRSNRSAIGARVTAAAGALSQTREVGGGQGMFSQNSLVLHFGLGGHASVDSLVIRWPRGTVQTLIDVAADQRLILTESSLIVTSPNGGESWTVGNSYDITWTADTASVTHVTTEYSTDNGAHWTLIDTTANHGAYTWTIPDTPSDSCRVRISDRVDGDPSDISDSMFSIRVPEPVLRVTSPNGGEAWIIGNSYDITWTADTASVTRVTIEYSTDNGAHWTTVIDSIASDSFYTWTIPDAPSGSCRVRISDQIDGDPWDVSDEIFAIVPEPTLILTSPNSGETWVVGNSYPITWIADTSWVHAVTIEYSTDNGAHWTLIDSTTNDGSHTWTIPDIPSDSCRVRVSDQMDGAPSDVSEGMFAIRVPLIWQVTLPTISASPGRILLIPVSVDVSVAAIVSSAQMRISYDSDVVRMLEAVILNTFTEDWTMEFDIRPGGDTPRDTLCIAIATAIDSLSESGTLILLRAIVSEHTTPGTTSPLVFEQFRFNDGEPSVETVDGTLNVISLLGDVSRNGDVGSYDASLVLRHVVGFSTLTGLDSTVADVSGNGTISAWDASLILRFVVGIISRFPAEGGVAKGVGTERSIALDPVEHAYGDLLRVPITIDDMAGVFAGELEIRLTPSEAAFVDIRPSDQTSVYHFAFRAQQDRIRVAFAGTESPTGPARIAEIILRPLRSRADPLAHLTIHQARLNEGMIPARIIEANADPPSAYRLFQNHPNPFNPETNISYDVAQAGTVHLTIYSLTGQHIRTLIHGEHPAGRYTATWDSRDDIGREVASGVYICRMQAGDHHAARKMLLVR